ncbi:hypothetical protein MKX01_005281 [Papaver californicum]|nr:hypothetical protein MKX01_005281 [Papaver californicum]
MFQLITLQKPTYTVYHRYHTNNEWYSFRLRLSLTVLVQFKKCRRPIIKAARTESKPVLLGSRPPDFQLVTVKLTNYYMKKGLAVVAISSNSVVTHPRDVLISQTYQSRWEGESLGAVCTPEFLLYRKVGRRPFELVYHGLRDLSMAIDSILSRQPLSFVQKPSVGCSIKWYAPVFSSSMPGDIPFCSREEYDYEHLIFLPKLEEARYFNIAL